MAVSYTTTYNLTKPEVGASEDAWGGLLNTNFDNLDNLLDGTTAITGIDINSGSIDGTTIGANSAAAITGTTITGTSFVSSGNMTFGDNDKAIFGAGSDLQIYHDGSDSYIDEQGAGNLYIRASNDAYILSASGEPTARFTTDGAVTLYHDNAVKLATTSTGIDVTGIVTADGLTVENGSSSKITIESTNTSGETGILEFYRTNASHAVSQIVDEREGDLNGGKLNFKTSDTSGSMKLRMDIDQGGDISFYEDTGTTPKFFWDASAERLGIGTSSPTRLLDVNGEAKFSGLIRARAGSATAASVGLNDDNTGLFQAGTNQIGFTVNGSEAARIDSSGNLLVGKTSAADINTNGFQVESNGRTGISRNSGSALILNRTSSDGPIAVFRKNGSTVGSIGSVSDGIFVGNGQEGIRFDQSLNSIFPCGSAGGANDNAMDFGIGSSRWDDIYATNGTIQTSDQNEKQQIASLTDAEITAAKAISKLFKTFKWNDSVAEKGDAARTHSGVIAQDVEQAMTDAGLNAGDYAFFISSTWWETQTEVPAVEAVDEVLDEDGNVITEAVEAQEAYTRTDTYETAEEAPEGATERNRKGIRYPQLLSFIGAATEQRLASIEARLDALEA
jgi:hypothetical protein